MGKIARQQIEEVANKIAKQYNPEKIILFGSYAWGNPTPDSDVDLFIVKDSEKKRWERESELRLKIFPPGIPLDLLMYTPTEMQRRLTLGDFFISDIVQKGKVLYEQQ